MAALSPYLNQNPTDLAYALGETSRSLELATGKWYEVEVVQNGGIVASSGRLREETLPNFYKEVTIYRRKRDKLHVRLRVTKFVQGYPYQAVFRLRVPIPQPASNGQVRLVLSGPMVQSSRAMRLSRPWTTKIGTSYRGVRLAVKRATTLRPSPEIRTAAFLQTLQFGDPTTFSTFPTVVPVTTYYRAWTGVRTPGFGSKRVTALPDNPHSVILATVGMNRYSWYQTRAANGSFDLRIRPFTSVLPVPSVPFLHLELAETNALKRLIQNAQVGIQANLALNIAQVSQLSNMIATNVAAMLSALRFLRRGAIPQAISALRAGRLDPRWQGTRGKPTVKRTLANNWLQLQYGWKPLLSDIEGFLKVMNAQLGAGDHVQRARSKASASRQVVMALPDTTGSLGKNAGKTIFSYQSTCKFTVRYRMDNPLLSLFSQTGFTNPVNLAWELIPFSFVADWFLPIGSYLEALKAWEGATFLGGSKTLFTRMKTDSTVAYNGPHPADSNVNVLNYANYRDEQIFFDRYALGAFPSPTVPRLQYGISGVTRASNAIALLTKALK